VTNEIQQTRYDRMVRRVAGIIGPGSKVSEVITELFPMIDVEDPPAELMLLGGTVLGVGSADVTAAATLFPKIQLFNPVDSGQIVTVTDIYSNCTTTTQIRVARTTNTLASGIATQIARDTRQIVTSLPTAQMFSEATLVFIDANMKFRQPAGTTLHIESKNDVMVLAPGTGIVVSNEISATRQIVTFFWRERQAETSELSL